MKKSIYIDEVLHKELKIQAVKQGISIYQLVEDIILDYGIGYNNNQEKVQKVSGKHED